MNRKCLLCQGKTSIENKRDGYFYYYCSKCMTLFLFPHPNKKNLDNYYKKTFDYSAGLANEELIRKRSKIILKQLLKLNPKGSKLLDIGSGYGFFLNEALEVGLKCYGIEPSKQLTSTSIYRYIDKLYRLNFDEYYKKFREEKYDFITLIHVIEHVPFPQKLIRKVVSLLKPSGVLYIETPNLDSHLYRAEKNNYTFLTPPDHLWIFSKKSHERMIPKNFKIKKYSTYSYPEHLMGILKAVSKSQFQPRRLEMGRQNNPISTNKTHFFYVSNIKYLLLDKFIAQLFYRFLNLNHYGSILELYIEKK